SSRTAFFFCSDLWTFCGVDCMVATDIVLSSQPDGPRRLGPGTIPERLPGRLDPDIKAPLRQPLHQGVRPWGGDPQGCNREEDRSAPGRAPPPPSAARPPPRRAPPPGPTRRSRGGRPTPEPPASIQADRLANPLHQERQQTLLAGDDLGLAGHPELDPPAVCPLADLLLVY